MIREDISAKGKEFLRMVGFKEVDSFISGAYEFYLLYNKNNDMFEIGMQRTGKEFTDMNQLIGTDTSNTLDKFSVSEIKRNIDNWLEKYHKIYCDSFDERKSRKWSSILSKIGYKVGTDDYVDPMLGRAANYISESKAISEMRKMRAPMFESENEVVKNNSKTSKNKMHPDNSSALTNPTVYPEMSSYGHYRALIYAASCPEKPAISSDSFAQDHPFSAGFSKEDQQMIDMSAKLLGYKPRKLGTGGYSTEPNTVHKNSPCPHNSGKHKS